MLAGWQVGAGLFQIVLTEFVVSKMIAVGTVWVFQLIARYQKVPYKVQTHSYGCSPHPDVPSRLRTPMHDYWLSGKA